MSALDAVELQVILGALRAACEEMGEALVRSAHSPNIKERRDASTALFDPDGEMVMQAEHIPVHLGSMPAAVRAVLDHEQHAGVSWVLNDPFAGGTHLPDITVVTPVFAHPDEPRPAGAKAGAETGAGADETGAADQTVAAGDAGADAPPAESGPGADAAPADSRLLGFAASRAHHADVGGRTPGSMPADSRTLADEGVVIAPQTLDEQTIERLTAQMRNPAERRADLRAQLAANRLGGERLRELADRVGAQRLRQTMAEVLDYAERRTRACIASLPDGVREARDFLEGADGDLELRLRATVAGEQLTLDFSGSAGRHAGNLNCPEAVTLSACWFAVRVLTDPDIPPSAGAYRPVRVIVPPGTLLNALPAPGEPAPAVAAGNVETSSRVADLVLRAFGRALGQGTMNNLTLGNERFAYYETIGGGQGACSDADGASGVHVAMSNTLNTPVEALERELPLRVREYALRRGSGGDGSIGVGAGIRRGGAGVGDGDGGHRGGDGVVREVEALTEMTYSLIAERRRHAPPGAAGGKPGAPGRDTLIDGDGREHRLPGKVSGVLRTGERLRIETPGGGGYGAP